MDDIFGFLHHLALGNPQGGFGDSDGKIVDLDAVKLSDGDLDRVVHIEYDLVVMQQGKNLILQPPQGQVGFRQEISRAAGGVYVLIVLDTKKNPFSGTEIPKKGKK